MEKQNRLTMDDLNVLEEFIGKVNQPNFPENLSEDQMKAGLRLYARFNTGTKPEDIDSKTDELFDGYLQWIDNPFIEFYENSRSSLMTPGPIIQQINSRKAQMRDGWFRDR